MPRQEQRPGRQQAPAQRQPIHHPPRSSQASRRPAPYRRPAPHCWPITPATGEAPRPTPCRFQSSRSAHRPSRGRGCFSHSPTVASVIDSPRTGTVTSVAILCFLLPGRGTCPSGIMLAAGSLGRPGGGGGGAFAARTPDFLANVVAQRIGDQRALFGGMPLSSSPWPATPRPHARIARTLHRALRLSQRFLDQRLDEEPVTVVLRLFLGPDHVLKVRHPCDPARKRVTGNG